MLFFVLTISVLLNLLCVWILLYKLVPSPSPRLFWFLPVLPRHFHTGCLHTTQRQHWREKKNYFLHCKRKAHKSNIDKSVNNTKETPEEKLFIHIIQIQQHTDVINHTHTYNLPLSPQPMIIHIIFLKWPL